MSVREGAAPVEGVIGLHRRCARRDPGYAQADERACVNEAFRAAPAFQS